jgi:hypothetical protein
MRTQADAYGRMATNLGGIAAAGRISNSIARQEQQRDWSEYGRRAGEMAEGYAEWATDAARNADGGQAATYAGTARQWHETARQYK